MLSWRGPWIGWVHDLCAFLLDLRRCRWSAAGPHNSLSISFQTNAEPPMTTASRPSRSKTPAHARLVIRVRGAVQGVGFRPFRPSPGDEPRPCGLGGQHRRGCRHRGGRPAGRLDALVEGSKLSAAPRGGHTESTFPRSRPLGETTFAIRPSALDGPRTAQILPDLATCDACLAELFDPSDRRHRYPVHQLHAMRAALQHHRGPALRPRADLHAALRDVPRPARRSTRTRPAGASTPSLSRAPTAARASPFGTAPAACSPEDDAALGLAAAAIRPGRDRCGQGRRRFPSARGCANEAAVRRLARRASTGRTSPSR